MVLVHTQNVKTDFKTFQKHDLQVITECNLARTDFLDVSFDLQYKFYKKFCKPRDTPLYINVRPNHLMCIKKVIPKMISHHIPSTSSSTKKFNEAVQVYNLALKTSSCKENVEYQKKEVK